MRLRKLIAVPWLGALMLVWTISNAADSPEAVFMDFHEAIVAGDLDRMLTHAPEAQKAEMAALPAEQKTATVALMSKLTPKEISVIGQSPGASSDELTLYAEGMGVSLMSGDPEKQYGTAAMVKEGGEWKVKRAEWNNKRPKEMPKAKAMVAAASETESAPPPPMPAPVPAQPTAVEPAPPPAASPAVAEAPAAPAPAAAPTPPPAPVAPKKPKEQCIIKQVMSNADIERCRRAAYGE